jgi:hypothetical protein
MTPRGACGAARWVRIAVIALCAALVLGVHHETAIPQAMAADSVRPAGRPVAATVSTPHGFCEVCAPDTGGGRCSAVAVDDTGPLVPPGSRPGHPPPSPPAADAGPAADRTCGSAQLDLLALSRLRI